MVTAFAAPVATRSPRPTESPIRRRAIAAILALLLGVLAALTGSAPAARAATIFTDSFASSLGGWTVANWSWNAGSALAIAPPSAGSSAMARSIDTSDYQNVELEFDYLLDNLSTSPSQTLTVAARPNGSSSYTTVGTYQSDTSGWDTATIDLSSIADLATAFQLQFIVNSPSGAPTTGWEARVDNVELSGDVDTTPPVVTPTNPTIPGTTIIPAATSTSWSVTVSDDVNAPGDVDVRYRFVSEEDPADTYTYAWTALTGTTTRTSTITGSTIAAWISLSAGDTFSWYVDGRDVAGNISQLYAGTFYYASTPPPEPPIITSGELPDGTQGVPYTFTVTASGDGTPTYSATGLPPGLSIAPGTGVISGTPTTAGNFDPTITVATGNPPNASATYDVTIAADLPPSVSASTSVGSWSIPATTSVTYSVLASDDRTAAADLDLTNTGFAFGEETFEVTLTPPASTGPFTVTVTGAQLQTALGLEPGDEFVFAAFVQDSFGNKATVEYDLVFGAAPTVAATPLPIGAEDESYGPFVVVTTGDPVPSVSATGLPAGLSISTSGVISGTPTAAGSFTVTVTADNGSTASRVFTLEVDPAEVVPTWPPTVNRVAGIDRYDTAARISQQSYPGGADVVYVSTGTVYPDALAAGPAAALEGGPLLLVTPASIPATVVAEITRLEPSRIVVIGGTPSVSTAVYSQLSGMADTIVRISGDDRFETSREVASEVFGDGAQTAYIATGLNFPDALAAGGAAGANAAPVILVNGGATGLDAATAQLLDELGVTSIRVLGSSASVSTGVFEDLKDIVDDTVRLAGPDRFETAREVNSATFPTADRVFFATGFNFPDALAGSAWAAMESAPLYTVLPTCVPQGVLDDIEAMGVTQVTLLGGTPSLSPSVASLTPCS